eukprot:scaffold11206_cov117-Isochrysis_galbana.AAC.18
MTSYTEVRPEPIWTSQSHTLSAFEQPRTGRVHHDVRNLEFDVDIEKWPLVQQETAGVHARADAALDRFERDLRAIEHCLVHLPREVSLQLLHVSLIDRHVGVSEGVAEDEAKHVLHTLLHLEVLGDHDGLLLCYMLLLKRDKLVDELQIRDNLEVTQEPIVNIILDLHDQIVEAHQLRVEGVQVCLDVHRRPSEVEHARLNDALELSDVGLEERLDNGQDARHYALVFGNGVREQVVVQLELVLLGQDHARALRDLLAHAHQTLGLAQELQNLAVEVDVEAVGRRVPYDERRLQTRLGRLDALGPREMPERLKFDDRPRNLVVHFDVLLRLLGRHEHCVFLELLHRLLDAAHELARPHHVACYRRRITHGRWRSLLLLVQPLHSLEVGRIVGEDDHELGLEVVLQRVALQRRPELLEQ